LIVACALNEFLKSGKLWTNLSNKNHEVFWVRYIRIFAKCQTNRPKKNVIVNKIEKNSNIQLKKVDLFHVQMLWGGSKSLVFNELRIIKN